MTSVLIKVHELTHSQTNLSRYQWLFSFYSIIQVRLNHKGQNQPSLLVYRSSSRDGICDTNGNTESSDLANIHVHSRHFPPCPEFSDTTTLTLPNVPKESGQRLVTANNNTLKIIDLDKARNETKFVRRKGIQMESITSNDGEQSDCQVFIANAVNQLSFNNDDDQGTLKKNTPLMKRFGKIVNNNHMDPFTNEETAGVRVQTPTLSCREKGHFVLPSLTNSEMRHQTVQEVPSITVCQDGESRASKATQQDLSLDPRFLMPTEVSQCILRPK